MKQGKVDICEFRVELDKYIAAGKAVAITCHGQTVGFFIPMHKPTDTDIAALKTAWDQLDQMLASKGIDPNDVIADFEAARAAARKPG